GSSATSSAFTPSTTGIYCFRAEYTPAGGSNYLATSHTNQSTTAPNNECFAFGVGSIKATKYHDRDANGSRAGSGEEGLSGWRLFIDTNNNQTYESGIDISPALTDSNGEVVFASLPSGSYAVCEVLQNGWHNSEPGSDANPCKTVNVTANASFTLDFGNYRNASITAFKYGDKDANGSFNG